MSRTDRRNGPYGDAAIRLPCRVASTVPITASGLQTTNGVVLVENDRVLRTGETDTTLNGIFIASTSTWQRPVDFDGVLDGVPGTLIVTLEGTLHPNTIWEIICADNPIVFGASAITFQVKASGTNTGDLTIAGQNYLSLLNQVLTANKISLANMADLAANSFIANNTGVAGVPLALNQAQATALLNAFAGDSGSGGTKGMVPAPATGDAAAGKFASADGTWKVPPTAIQATESVAGIAELATQAETNTGTDDLTIVTPLKLANRPGIFAQAVNSVETGAVISGTTQIPFDDTIPQNTEGDQYFSIIHTPKSATNDLYIDIGLMVSGSVLGVNLTAALFQDSNVNAIAAVSSTCAQDYIQVLYFNHKMTAGTTSAITFKVRIGGDQVSTTTLNGKSGSRRLGGVACSSITIKEIKP